MLITTQTDVSPHETVTSESVSTYGWKLSVASATLCRTINVASTSATCSAQRKWVITQPICQLWVVLTLKWIIRAKKVPPPPPQHRTGWLQSKHASQYTDFQISYTSAGMVHTTVLSKNSFQVQCHYCWVNIFCKICHWPTADLTAQSSELKLQTPTN